MPIIATPIDKVARLKYLIHPVKECKYQQLEQSKEESLQGSSYAITNMTNLRSCPRSNMMRFLNIISIRKMTVRSRNKTKEIQTIISIQKIKRGRK